MTGLSHKTLTLPKWLLGTDRKVENAIDRRASTWETGVVPKSKQVSVAEHCVQLVDYDRHKIAFRPYLMNCLRAFRKQKADRAHEFEILSEIDPTTRQWPIFLIHYGPSASVLDFAFEKLLHIDDAECWQQPVLVCRTQTTLGEVWARHVQMHTEVWGVHKSELHGWVGRASKSELVEAGRRYLLWGNRFRDPVVVANREFLLDRIGGLPEDKLRSLATLDSLEFGSELWRHLRTIGV